MGSTNLEQMTEFVAARNNVVRFDTYMKEHLFGEGGYYAKNVVIGENGHFTTYAERPTFAFLIYLALKKEQLAGKQFLEIGGGSGTFKKHYLHYSPETDYISVDASAKLLAEQSKFGRNTHIGRAENLPLEDGSIEGIIFGNELLDELPCRVFMIRNLRGKASIGGEGHVSGENGQLAFEYRQAERDDFFLLYESFLRESGFSIKDGSVISVSPVTQTVISEMARVLKKGKILLFDYGYWNNPDQQEKRRYGAPPYFMEKYTYHSVSHILKRPYETDLTHPIDFDFLKWHAIQTGFFSAVNLSYLSDFCKKIVDTTNFEGYEKEVDLDTLNDIETFLSSTSMSVLELEKA